MKNIAIVIGNITKGAGTERAVTNLANMLVRNGDYSVMIISMNTSLSDKPYYELESKILIEHMGLTANFTNKNKLLYYTIFLIRIQKLLRMHKIEYVLGTTHAINSMLAISHFGGKKIGCEHMNYAGCPRISAIIRKICYKRLDSLVVLTKSDARHYSFINEKKLFVIPNSLSYVCDKPTDLINKRIIAVGRLTEQKGFDLLIQSAVLIKEKLPDWRIDIFGDGEDKEKLISLIQKNELSQWVYINPPTKKIKDELLSSSLYVMSSRWEGLPMILLEAKACGLPIVSFNCPEGPSDVIVDGEDGFLVECENVKKLAEKVVYVCQNEKLLKKMGRESYNNIEKFSEKNVFTKWDGLFSLFGN